MGKKNKKKDINEQYVQDLCADTPIEAVKMRFRYTFSAGIVAILPIVIIAVIFCSIFRPVVNLFQKDQGQAETFESLPAAESISMDAEMITEEVETEAVEETAKTTEEKCQVRMTVQLNGTVMKEGETYYVKPLDKITISAWSSEAAIERIGYYTNLDMSIRDTFDNDAYITIPEMESGTKVQLFIEAVAENDNGSANTVTKTGWKKYYLIYE